MYTFIPVGEKHWMLSTNISHHEIECVFGNFLRDVLSILHRH